MHDLINILVKYHWEIIGTLVMAAIGAYLRGLNNRRNRLAVASAAFRNVFLTELKGLYPIPSNWPTDIESHLIGIFPKLQSAVAEFRLFLSWYRRKCFDKAWRIYHLGNDGREIDEQDYWQYTLHISTSVANGKEVTIDDTRTTYKETFKHNVDNLLKYAKQT